MSNPIAFAANSNEDETLFVAIGVDSIEAFEQAVIANKLTGEDPQDPDYAYDKPLQAWAVLTLSGWSLDAASATPGARPAMVATAFWVGEEHRSTSKCTSCAVQQGTHVPAGGVMQIQEPTMPYEAWRISYQSSEQAARAAYARMCELEAQLAAAQQGVQQVPWCPDVCPITGRKFFMWIEHWETGKDVPTYGGPYDSYTIPVKDSDGTFSCERYDHDAGKWMTEGMGWECVGLMLVDDQSFVVEPNNPRYMEIENFATHPTTQGLDAQEYQRGYQDGYNRRDAEVKGALV